MPELPEVETVAGLNRTLSLPDEISGMTIRNAALRRPIDPRIATWIQGQQLLTIERGKIPPIPHQFPQLNQPFGHDRLLATAQQGEDPGKHDHVLLHFKGQPDLIYRDPRRFGLLEDCAEEEQAQHRCFNHLGPSPLAPTSTQATSRRS